MTDSNSKLFKFLSYLQVTGIALVIIGSLGYFFNYSSFKYIFALGALAVVIFQLVSIYTSKNPDFRVKKRNRLNLMLSLLLALAAYSMFDGTTLWMAIILIYALVTLLLTFRNI